MSSSVSSFPSGPGWSRGSARRGHHIDRLGVRRRGGGERILDDDHVEAVTVGRLEGGRRDAVLGPRSDDDDGVDAPRLEHRVEDVVAVGVAVGELGEVERLDHERLLVGRLRLQVVDGVGAVGMTGCGGGDDDGLGAVDDGVIDRVDIKGG